MPNQVIHVVEAIAESEEQPLTHNSELIFKWALGVPIDGEQVYDDKSEIIYEEDQAVEDDFIVYDGDETVGIALSPDRMKMYAGVSCVLISQL